MRRRSHPVVVSRTVAATLCVAVLVACSPDGPAAGPGSSPGTISTSASGDDPAAGTDDGARLDTGGALIELRQTPGVVDAASGRAVAAILADLETFWSQQLGGAFTAPRGGYLLTDTADVRGSGAAGSSTGPAPTSTTGATGSPLADPDPDGDYGCAGSADALRGNAFYCPGQDSIVVDAGALVPVVRSSFGIGGLAAALAHEYGHLVQARTGPTSAQQRDDPERYPQVLVEAQADCAAGAYLAWAAGVSAVPGTSRLELPVQALPRSISTLVDFRDSATGPTSDLFHGYGLDRLRAVVRGYEQGPRSCSAMTADDLDLTLGRAGTVAPRTDPRFADPAAVAAAATAALTSFDRTAPRGATADPADLTAAAEIGQFAQAAATVLAVGRRQRPQAAECYLGAFTGARYGRAAAGSLGSWRSDADEAMDLVIARATGSATGWEQIAGFVRGFGDGLAACR